MKRGHLVIVFLIVSLIALLATSLASAYCELNVNLLNQDPYPAVPGEYVKVVLQLTGVDSPDCDRIFLDVENSYPFFKEENITKVILPGSTKISGYSSYFLKAYKLRVDKDALDGDNILKVKYGLDLTGYQSISKDISIHIQDSRTDFDVIIQDYDLTKNTITFAVVNTGKYDVESLILEVPQQDNLEVKGNNKIIIGSLNSNDDTTATLEALPKEGEILVKLNYNDQNNERRTVEKTIIFNKGYLEKSKNGKTSKSGYFYLFWLLILVLVAFFVYRRYQDRKAKKQHHLLQQQQHHRILNR